MIGFHLVGVYLNLGFLYFWTRLRLFVNCVVSWCIFAFTKKGFDSVYWIWNCNKSTYIHICSEFLNTFWGYYEDVGLINFWFIVNSDKINVFWYIYCVIKINIRLRSKQTMEHSVHDPTVHLFGSNISFYDERNLSTWILISSGVNLKPKDIS